MNKTMVVLFSGVMLTGLFTVPAAADEKPATAEAAPGDSEESPEWTDITLYEGYNYTGQSFHITPGPGCYTLPTAWNGRTRSVRTPGTIGLCMTRDCNSCLVIVGDRSNIGQYSNRVSSIWVYN